MGLGAMVRGKSGTVFICYRRTDTRVLAGRLCDRLKIRLPRQQLFMDTTDTPVGTDFVERITGEVERCSTILVLIGPSWLALANPSGGRRLDDPDDYVVMEIGIALRRRVRVVPILVDGTTMPTEQSLPSPIGIWPAARRSSSATRTSTTTWMRSSGTSPISRRRNGGSRHR